MLILTETRDNISIITLNRPLKANALDIDLLNQLGTALQAAIAHPKTAIILLKANGDNFCAGADIDWMQNSINHDYKQNLAEALVLADLIYALYASPKITIAMIQGKVYGGGIGLVAASDIAIAGSNSTFCFPEVKLGLIPAVISPYIIQAIGARIAKHLFISAQTFNATYAASIHLIHQVVNETALETYTYDYLTNLIGHAPQAVKDCKRLIHYLVGKSIDRNLSEYTADIIATKRISIEGQRGLKAFLAKHNPIWDV